MMALCQMFSGVLMLYRKPPYENIAVGPDCAPYEVFLLSSTSNLQSLDPLILTLGVAVEDDKRDKNGTSIELFSSLQSPTHSPLLSRPCVFKFCGKRFRTTRNRMVVGFQRRQGSSGCREAERKADNKIMPTNVISFEYRAQSQF